MVNKWHSHNTFFPSNKARTQTGPDARPTRWIFLLFFLFTVILRRSSHTNWPLRPTNSFDFSSFFHFFSQEDAQVCSCHPPTKLAHKLAPTPDQLVGFFFFFTFFSQEDAQVCSCHPPTKLVHKLVPTPDQLVGFFFFFTFFSQEDAQVCSCHPPTKLVHKLVPTPDQLVGFFFFFRKRMHRFAPVILRRSSHTNWPRCPTNSLDFSSFFARGCAGLLLSSSDEARTQTGPDARPTRWIFLFFSLFFARGCVGLLLSSSDEARSQSGPDARPTRWIFLLFHFFFDPSPSILFFYYIIYSNSTQKQTTLTRRTFFPC
ncbi:uncharacterized protein LOC128092927 [Culex pipiens pallens]|uniref:uncharacterized protein LOC128092927 n=1 Tax=Culex pipiens pallens TaxID=42434 RepID=UPI0022AAE941|nr:uncharacterized protein LOC128092927 [Culex pipiens pallens]